MEHAKHWFLRAVESFLNLPYKWGGDDPTGFDCSGMVVEGLRACGLMGIHEDLSAYGLWHKFSDKQVPAPRRGALVFWFADNGKANHVAVCLDEHFCLTADAGGRHVQTADDAEKYNAFVKIRPISHRKSTPKYIYLF